MDTKKKRRKNQEDRSLGEKVSRIVSLYFKGKKERERERERERDQSSN